jgi:hypothetical protein
MDHYAQGTYGKGRGKSFKACSIGCTIHSLNRRLKKTIRNSNHAELAEQLGIPEFITRMADSIFERLPFALATEWTERWINAIPEGADCSLAVPRFMLRTLDRLPAPERKDVVEACKDVKPMLRDWIETGVPDIAMAKAASASASAFASASAYAYAYARISIELLANDFIAAIEECGTEKGLGQERVG